MNIVKVLKSFDIFNSQAVKFLKEKAINIFLIETPSKKHKAINFSSDKNSVTLNVVNKPKTYNLLISAQKRINEKRLQSKQAAKL